MKTRINVSNWRKQKEIQKNKNRATLLQLGFSTLFLNRTNISGIMDAGPIGGIEQEGTYKIGCRLNKRELVKRIRRIAENKSKINLYQLDALELIEQVRKEKSKSSETMFYFDPPYYLKGESLYMNHYTSKDHEEVNRSIRGIKGIRWIVSYDNVPAIRAMYRGFRSRKYRLLHRARNLKVGKEVLFFSNNLSLPRTIDRMLLPGSL